MTVDERNRHAYATVAAPGDVFEASRYWWADGDHGGTEWFMIDHHGALCPISSGDVPAVLASGNTPAGTTPKALPSIYCRPVDNKETDR